MDLNTIGIGAVLGAILVAGTNLYIFVRNSNKAELKERIEKLYSPLYELLFRKYEIWVRRAI